MTTKKQTRCPGCGHSPHVSGGCLNMTSDNDCNCKVGATERATEPAELKPCPFCGSGQIRNYKGGGEDEPRMAYCVQCGVEIEFDKWNARASAPAPDVSTVAREIAEKISEFIGAPVNVINIERLATIIAPYLSVAPDNSLAEGDACPCTHGAICDPNCSCVHPYSSRGCAFCCSYGSAEQKETRAVHLRKLILAGIQVERAPDDNFRETVVRLVEELEEAQFGVGAHALSGKLRERLAALPVSKQDEGEK